ncbi:F-box/LRR-repeat protein 3-like [Aphidius gifuensis]|uniref:F-box/LRR-repeat protein 3-like n=1 Tax=Aphidius gifuensis TaxID=684658 RepID=UPI001CDB50CD|nr:F-box/LRR-repeat protein 3-like [Aphidius gifuensis]
MPDLANAIVEYCKNLKHLKIHDPGKIMNETALNKLTELENLESLILVINVILREESIIAISNNCKKLKHLTIGGRLLMPTIDGKPLSSPSVLDELSKLQYLEVLYLCGTLHLKDSTIIAIANNCKNLRLLAINRCTAVTETAFVAITNLKNLQELDVTSPNITDDFIIKLKGLKKLICFKCRELTNAGIIQFIKNNPDLEVIDVSGIKNITNDLIIAADHATRNRTNGIILHLTISDPSIIPFLTRPTIKSQWLVKLTELENLESLSLVSHIKLSKESIIAISNNCKKLKHLEIPGRLLVPPVHGSSPTVLDELSRLQYLEHLHLCGTLHLRNSTIFAIANNCKNLRILEIENCTSITKIALIALTNLKNLQKLDVTLVNITDDFIIKLKGLKELKCSYCQELTNADISMGLQRFRNLHKLTSLGLRSDNINLREIADITTLVHLKIGLYTAHIFIPLILFNKLVNLEYIDLTMAEIPLEKWLNFQNLQHLGIACNMMPDLANTIVEYCKNLKHLKIHNTNRLMNETALKKLTELENLESLSLVFRIKLSEESIIAISNNCKKLKRLEIPDSFLVPFIDGEPLSSPSVLDELSNLQYLEHLNLHKFNYPHEGINLEDSTIIAIANNCKNLKILQIQNHRNITERGLVALTNLENLQKLEVDSLNITDDFIIELKGLKELDCSYCRKLTNAEIPGRLLVPPVHGSSPTVLDELSRLQYLEHLHLCGTLHLRNSTIFAIANNCKNLRILEIENCTSITKIALIALTNLKNLQKLDVTLVNITDDFIIKLKGLKELKCSYCQELTNAESSSI